MLLEVEGQAEVMHANGRHNFMKILRKTLSSMQDSASRKMLLLAYLLPDKGNAPVLPVRLSLNADDHLCLQVCMAQPWAQINDMETKPAERPAAPPALYSCKSAAHICLSTGR